MIFTPKSSRGSNGAERAQAPRQPLLVCLSASLRGGFFLAALLLALSLPNCAWFGGTTHIPPADLRVMTFNMRLDTPGDGPNRWDLRRDIFLELIRNDRPHLLGLQEALRNQLDDVLRAFPEYGSLGVGREDGRDSGEFSAILYRTDRFAVKESGTFWFSDTPDKPGSKHWGNRNTRICTWGVLTSRETDDPLAVYNLHLDHESQPSRERSVLLLADTLQRRSFSCPVIVMGDFNAGASNPAIQFFLGHESLNDPAGVKRRNPVELLDTFRSIHPEGEEPGTYHAFTGKAVSEKIDYIFVSSGVEIAGATIIRSHGEGRFPSDHFPVTATLQLPAPNPRRSPDS